MNALYRALGCIVLLGGSVSAAPERAFSFELRLVLESKEDDSEMMKFGDDVLHVSNKPLLRTEDFVLKDPPVSHAIELYQGVRTDRFGVSLKLTDVARTKLRMTFKEENFTQRGAFVLDGRIISVPVIKVGALTAENGFSFSRKSKKACERLVGKLLRAEVKQEGAQQGEEPDAGNASP